MRPWARPLQAEFLKFGAKVHEGGDWQQLFEQVHALLTQQDAPADPAQLGKLAALSGVREFPARVKCASLCWHTLNAALDRSHEPVKTE